MSEIEPRAGGSEASLQTIVLCYNLKFNASHQGKLTEAFDKQALANFCLLMSECFLLDNLNPFSQMMYVIFFFKISEKIPPLDKYHWSIRKENQMSLALGATGGRHGTEAASALLNQPSWVRI